METRRVKLGDICDIKAGGTPSRNKKEYWNGDIKWLKISDIKSKYISTTKETITSLGVEKSSTKIFDKGTIVYTIFATLGEVAILNESMATNQAIAGIKILDENNIYLDYLYFYLISIKSDILDMGRGVAQNNINLKILRDIQISLPPPQKQKQIANTLDKAKELIDLRKESLKKLDILSKSLFIDMFGDPVENPMGWESSKFDNYIDYIGDIGSNGSNAVISKNLKMLDYEDYAIMIRTTNLNNNDFTNNLKYVSKETYDFFKKSKIFGGELIMNKIGSAGKFWMMPYLNRPVSLGLNQLVIRLKEVNSKYIYYFLSTEYGKSVINSKTNGAVTKSITKGAVKDINIIVTPLTLQNNFAKKIEKIEEQKALYEKQLEKLQENFDALLQKSFEVV